MVLTSHVEADTFFRFNRNIRSLIGEKATTKQQHRYYGSDFDRGWVSTYMAPT